MAVITIDFYSRELKMSTLLTVIAPDAVRMEGRSLSQRPCLYLLHGLSDDATAPLRLSKIELYAQETGVVVVTPSVGRSMYCDQVLGQNYFRFVAEEVPEYLRLLMGLNPAPQQSYVAGISMGGLGAARLALNYPERFRGAALLSGLLDLRLLLPRAAGPEHEEFPFLYDAVIADPEQSPLNPVNLLRQQTPVPQLELAVYCGRQDDLFPMSQSFLQTAQAAGWSAGAHFTDGRHEWRLWDGYLDELVRRIAAGQSLNA